jgi:hypothetical protein
MTFVSPGAGGVHGSELPSGMAEESAALGYRLAIEEACCAGWRRAVRRAFCCSSMTTPRRRARWTSCSGSGAVVVVDRYFPGLPTDAVIFDDFAIGYEVTSAMLDRGHRYPAMLWSESDATSVRDLSPLAVVSARLPRGKWDGRPRLTHERIEGAGTPQRHVVLRAPVHVADREQNTLAVVGAGAARR